MILVLEQLLILRLDIVLLLQGLVPAFEEDLILVPSILHIGAHLLVPVHHLVLGLLADEVLAGACKFLSGISFTFEASTASCLMISISLSTLRMSFLTTLMDCYLLRDLMTNELRDFLVDASSLYISLTWF